ncbi:MAG: hypothetical protein ACK4YD_02240 [Chitinophagia bacterium]|jgi:hypothetical protein
MLPKISFQIQGPVRKIFKGAEQDNEIEQKKLRVKKKLKLFQKGANFPAGKRQNL